MYGETGVIVKPVRVQYNALLEGNEATRRQELTRDRVALERKEAKLVSINK